jgi:hypothetical protein
MRRGNRFDLNLVATGCQTASISPRTSATVIHPTNGQIAAMKMVPTTAMTSSRFEKEVEAVAYRFFMISAE